RFLCPRCSAPYKGLDSNGLPHPRRFNCRTCGEDVRVEDMPFQPPHGVAEARLRADLPPFGQEGARGMRAAWRTVSWSMGAPYEIVRRCPLGVWGALKFALGATVVATLGTALAILSVAVIPMLTGGPGGGGGNALLVGAAWIGLMIFGWVGIVVPICGAIAHGMLRITGKTEHSIGTTVAIAAYAQGPLVICFIPCPGIYLQPIASLWGAITAIFMLQRAHRVSGLRATVAALAPPVLVVIGIFAVYIPFFVNSMNMAVRGGFNPPPGGFGASLGVSPLAREIRADIASSRPPSLHVFQMSPERAADPDDFLAGPASDAAQLALTDSLNLSDLDQMT
ncbi:MAG: Yip1 family protein, partial [Planctomycetota bacterium]|nr:Yip1 family protein [Planctomycetota bacterium]